MFDCVSFIVPWPPPLRRCFVLFLILMNGLGLSWAQGDVNLYEGVSFDGFHPVAFIPVAEMLADKTNDIASWYDEEEGQTYLMVGCNNGTALFRMLPGGRPLFMGKMPTQTVNSLWRDVKVVNDHAFVASEAPAHGMQVLDLTALREWQPMEGATIWNPDTVIASPGTAHNLVSFDAKSMVIQVGSTLAGGGAVFFDVSEAGSPALVGSAGEWGGFHDGQALVYDGPDAAHVGKDVLFAAGSQHLWILDFSDPSDVQLISSATYPNAHFSHQVWVPDGHDHAFLGDELDETSEGLPTRTFVFDLTDLDSPVLAEIHEAGNTASDHNQYSYGEWLIQSNYRAGLRMLSDEWPNSPALVERAYFDPLVNSNAPGFEGAWSHVVLAEEGVLAFSSINQGLWVVRPEFAQLSDVIIDGCQTGVGADPSSWSMTLSMDTGWVFPVTVELEGVNLPSDELGQWIMQNPGDLNLAFLAWGIDGVQPTVNLTSQRSTWKLNILNSDAQWPGQYADEDGDGFGNPNLPVWGCDEMEGTSAIPLDCQDWNPNTYPLAPELCDGWNNDCDDEVDEGTTQLMWYLDADGDGFGSDAMPAELSCLPLSERVLIAGDCNDNMAVMYPGAPLLMDGLDNNCDGEISPSELNPCMGDFDMDGVRTINDMLHLLSSFGCSSGCTASLNAEDNVATDDLLLWLGVFGLNCE